jgi:hypothetical protein
MEMVPPLAVVVLQVTVTPAHLVVLAALQMVPADDPAPAAALRVVVSELVVLAVA